jgi:hypothetical protein
LFVLKKSGELRMVIDYRRLNTLTTRSPFPIPNVSDIIDQLRSKTHFTVLDLKSGYHQVLVREEDRHKTAFVTPQGLYEFTVMPFGLTGAPSTFCQLMSTVNFQHLLVTGHTGLPSYSIRAGHPLFKVVNNSQLFAGLRVIDKLGESIMFLWIDHTNRISRA